MGGTVATPLSLPALMKEIRARSPAASLAPDRRVALYGPPRPELATILTSTLIDDAQTAQRRAYAVDQRVDLFEDQADAAREAARAVAVLVRDDRVKRDGNAWVVQSEVFGDRYSLCTAERFRSQPIVGFGSAVLVASDLVATAAHCVAGVNLDQQTEEVQRTLFVFGFAMQDASTAVTRFAADRVFRGHALVARTFDPATGSDWAIVRLERSVSFVAPRRIARTKVADRAPVSVIGHPCGLPAKYAAGAQVRANTAAGWFRADLDAFGGNSGSPVFNQRWEVEGLLVRGAPDFVWDGRCRKSMIIPVRNAEDDPPGEDVVRCSEFASHVPE